MTGRVHPTRKDVRDGPAALFTRIPGLDNGGAAIGNGGEHLRMTAENNKHYGFSCFNECADELFLISRQADAVACAVFTTEIDILAHGGYDYVALRGKA